MKRLLCLTLVALFGTAIPAVAQSIYVGVGPTFPTGDFGEYAGTGFMLAGGVEFEVASQLSIYGEGFWGQNDHDTDGDKTNPSGFMGGLLYGFGGDDAPLTPYVFGGVGLMTHAYSSDTFEDSSDSAFGFQGGAGVGFDLGGLDAFAEGRYMSASFDFEVSPGETASETTAFVGIVLGLSFDVGG